MQNNIKNHPMIFLLFLLTVMAGLLLLISSASLGYASTDSQNVNTTTSRTTTAGNHVISGDTQEYMTYEGLAPNMQPQENGMQTNPMPGTFEWWYLHAFFTDGSTTQLIWQKALV